MKFGDWTFVKDGARKNYKKFYTVKCKCGLVKDVQADNLISGKSKCCRKCYHEKNVTHGHGRKTKGSRARPGLYGTWEGMKGRCLNPNHTAFKSYGGRGITVCERWLDFSNFNEDMASSYEKGLQLDRINNQLGYSKDNCRWVTTKQNARNKRSSRFETYKNETKTIAEWAEILGFIPETLRRRINEWGVERAFETPLISTRSRSKRSTTRADSSLS